MITITPLGDKNSIEELFRNNGIDTNEYSGAVVAKSGEEVLGFCLYELYKTGITILHIFPKDDLPLADGILRSALNIAALRGALDARYVKDDALFRKLGFILNEKDKKLDIDKLFRGCGSHT